MHPQIFEAYIDDRAKVISRLSNYLETASYFVQNINLNTDCTRSEFSIGEYSFFVEGRIYLTNKDNPIIIRTFEKVTQTERTLPNGEVVIKAIPALDIVFNVGTPQLKVTNQALAYPVYTTKLLEYIAEIEKVV